MKRMGWISMFGGAALLMAAIPCIADEISRQSATGACMLSIKQMLHDPGSAEFDHSREAGVLIKGNRAVVIRSVRAKNGFGAMRLQEFMCFLEASGDVISPVLVVPRGEKVAQANALYKKWKMP